MTATQSEERPWWQKEPHSARPHSPGEGRAGPNASGRAGAREGSDPTAQFQGDSAPQSAVTEGEENGYDLAAVWAEWQPRFQRLLCHFTPPDIVGNDRPGLAKRWSYADRAEWTTEGGVPRGAGRVYNIAVAPLSAALLYLDWIIERPTRLIVAGALVFLLAQFPPLSWLI